MKITRATITPSAHEQLLYFTSSSLVKDDKRLVFISDRDRHPNLFVRNLENGQERQLTQNTDGYLKSYVYFDGNPYRGFAKASISLHSPSGTVYYIQGREIRSVDLEGHQHLLNTYPEGQMTAFTHVSEDGKFLCVPTTDDRALDGDKKLSKQPEYDIDARVQSENLSSYLRIFDTKSGEQIHCEQVSRAWITHVQFSPKDNQKLLYNHEWPADCGIRRMWLWDGKSHHRLRNETSTQSKGDWTCHEMWTRDGQFIIYHGAYANEGPAYIGRIRADGSDPVEISLPASWKRYGHFTTGGEGMLVTDGYYEPPEGEDSTNVLGWGGQWICVMKVDWDKKKIDWLPISRHRSSWDSQDSHPHPIFDHSANRVYFTSDFEGKRAVYYALVPA